MDDKTYLICKHEIIIKNDHFSFVYFCLQNFKMAAEFSRSTNLARDARVKKREVTAACPTTTASSNKFSHLTMIECVLELVVLPIGGQITPLFCGDKSLAEKK